MKAGVGCGDGKVEDAAAAAVVAVVVAAAEVVRTGRGRRLSGERRLREVTARVAAMAAAPPDGDGERGADSVGDGGS